MSPYKILFIIGILPFFGIACSLKSDPACANLRTIEELYQKVFEMENQSQLHNQQALIKSIKDKFRGESEEDYPFWSIPQRDLLGELRKQPWSPSKKKRIRLHLMEKFGIISSFVKMPRSKPVERYVSCADDYAFDMKDIKEMARKGVPLSHLLDEMLKNQHLYR